MNIILSKRIRKLIHQAEIKGYKKAKKDFDRKSRIQEEAYNTLLKEKNKMLDEQIKFSEIKRNRIIEQIEKEYINELSTHIQRNENIINQKNNEIDNLNTKIQNLTQKFNKEIETIRKETEKYIETKEKELYSRELELIKSEEFIQNFFITLLTAIEKVKEKSSQVSASTYRHDNALKELAQMSMRISNIILEMGKHNQDLIKLTDSLSDISIKFDKQSTKLSILNKIRAKKEVV